MSHQNLVFRTDINGLRALAVTSVVAFHAARWLVPGGFVGVDIFFVISGYLISRIIFTELTAGDFSFRDFYAKRAKRIFPALVLVMVCVWVTAWMMFDPAQLLFLGRHIIGGSYFILNFQLMREGGYFDIVAETKPLLHLWSLSIEEQFYVIWPALVWVLFRFRKLVLPVIVLIFLASLSFNLY